MKYIINKKISCVSSEECSDTIREKIENEFSCKLMAIDKNDTVHGSVSILHEKNNHNIIIEFYEQNETRENQPTLKKLSKIPSETEIKKVLE